jgi:hypothetical protein
MIYLHSTDERQRALADAVARQGPSRTLAGHAWGTRRLRERLMMSCDLRQMPDDLRLCGGGASETRTRDPLLAKQVLFQLSYSPFG